MNTTNPFINSSIYMPSPISIPWEKSLVTPTWLIKSSKKVLETLDPIDPKKREENILLVNDKQNWLLQQNGTSVISWEKNDEFHRKLVVYFRPTQINYVSRVQVIEIMRFLQYYVEQGYSSLFDDFMVLYRFPDTDMLDEFEKNSHPATGIDFRLLSSIYANTVHFSNGTPDFIPGTIPILGTTPHKRWKQHMGRYVHLPLEYETVEKIGHRHGIISPSERKNGKEITESRKLIPVLNTVLQTIQKTEAIMIKNSSLQ